MTLAELLEALGLTSTPEFVEAIASYTTAQTVALKANRDQLLKDVKDLKTKIKAFDGINPTELAEVLAELDIDADGLVERLRAPAVIDPKNPDVAKQITDAVAAAEAKLTRKLAKGEKDLADANTALAAANKARIDENIERVLTAELATQKGNVDLLSPMLRGRIKGEIDAETGKVNITVLAANGEEMVAAGGQVATVATLVETIKADEKFGAAFEADGGGSGAGGNKKSGQPTGKNPWIRGPNYSLTEQNALSKNNPTLAASLKLAAQRAA